MSKKIFICHAGSSLENNPSHDNGIIGVAYQWNGEWIRSPSDVEGRDRNPAMKLKPLFGPNVEVYGDVGCFSASENFNEQAHLASPIGNK